MALPSTTRPAYLDNLFHANAASLNKTPSLRSAHSSISSTASSAISDPRLPHNTTRPLSPAYEEDDADADDDDRASLRSLRLQFSPRRSLRNLLHRRTYPQVKEIVDVEFPGTASRKTPSLPSAPHHDRRPSTRGAGTTASRRPSLPKLHTSSSLASFKSQAELYASKPLPAAPGAGATRAEELRCQPCYYFAARHCNGYVFGGAHGDACENCLAAGFFGAS